MKYLLFLIVWGFKSKNTISKWNFFLKNVSRSLKCVCFIKKCRCVLCLVLSSLHTYSFGCFWVKLYVFDDVCVVVVVVGVVAVHSYHQFSEIFTQLSSSLVHVVCVCTLGYGICMLFELRDLVCLIVCCAALCLRCFWFFVLFLVFYIFILQLLVFFFFFSSLLFTLLLTANGVYVAMVEFFFYLCRLLYYDISSVFVSVDSFHQVRFFIFFLNSVYRIWCCFVHFISFIKSVFTSIGASLLPLFFSLLVICASVCI